MSWRESFGTRLLKSKLQSRWGARMLCLPALRVAAARVLGGTVSAARENELGVVVVMAAEARVSKVHLRQVRGSRSTAAMGFYFPSPGPRRNAIVAFNPAAGITRHLGVTYQRRSGSDLEVSADAEYSSKAANRRSMSGGVRGDVWRRSSTLAF